MTWHAIDSLEDALQATKELLLPFSLKRWLTVAVAVLFVSGTGGIPGLNTGAGAGSNVNTGSRTTTSVPDSFQTPGFEQMSPDETMREAMSLAPRLTVVLAIVGFFLLLGIAILYISSVMEFVFLKIAARQEVRIRGFFGESRSKGFSLFLFRLVIGLVIAATVATIVLITFLTGGVFLIFLVLLSPVFLLFVVGLWLVTRFTVDFVVPVMLTDDVGILEGWKAFLSVLREEWKQYGIYAVARFVLGIAASVVAGVGAVALLIVLGIPFAVVGLIFYLLPVAAGAQTVGFVLLGGVVVLFVLTLVVAVVTFVQVPIQTYLRYYSLFVLGSISPEYDLVEDIRGKVEEGSEENG